jgi:hypothetical protein
LFPLLEEGEKGKETIGKEGDEGEEGEQFEHCRVPFFSGVK